MEHVTGTCSFPRSEVKEAGATAKTRGMGTRSISNTQKLKAKEGGPSEGPVSPEPHRSLL